LNKKLSLKTLDEGNKTLSHDGIKRLARNKKPQIDLELFYFVPKTGFEPAHGFPRCDLNTVRLPISPLGHKTNVINNSTNYEVALNKPLTSMINRKSLQFLT
jgi:hypothetical protein